MPRLRRVATILGAVAIAAAVPAYSLTPKPKPCAKGKVARTVNGARTCVAGGMLRPAAAPESVATQRFRVLLSRVIAPKPKRPSGVPRPMPRALQRAAVAAFADMELTLTAAVQAARTKSVTGRSRTTADPAPTVTVNPDGTASGQFGRTIEVGGQSIAIELEIGGRTDGTLTVGADTTYTDAAGTKVTTRMTVREGYRDPAFCPSETGAFPLRASKGWTSSKTETFGSERVKAGVTRLAYSGDVTQKVQAQLNADAVLQPIPFTVTASNDFAFSFQGAAFFQARYRITGNATMSGTIDPKTGALSDATVKVTMKDSGPDAALRAKLKAEFQRILEKQLRDTTGQILKDARVVETRAQSGGCTRISLLPDSGPLEPGQTATVNARLDAKNNLTVPTAKWTASATKGSVSPSATGTAKPAFSIVGAPPVPRTASVQIRAVSPAGISEATWVGTGGEPLRLHIAATGTFTGSDEDVDATVTGSIEYDAVLVPGEPGNYDLPTATHWAGLSQTVTGHSTCPVTPTAPVSLFPQPASSAATRQNGIITVFLTPTLVAGYNRTTAPDLGCFRPTAAVMVPVTLAALPGLSIATTAGVPTRVTASKPSGTYDITVTVTELTQ